MIKTRYKKIFRDITTDFMKSALLILAITIGLLGIGVVLGAYSVLSREMTQNYKRGEPASATFDIASDSIPAGLLFAIENINGVKDAERRATVITQMKLGNQWYRLLLFVIDDFSNMKMARLTKEAGEWPPPEGTMLVERSALSFMNSTIGNLVTIKGSDGQEKEIKISGKAFDSGVAPAWQDEMGYGYITTATLRSIRFSNPITELKILVADSINTDEREIKKIALLVADRLQEDGYAVHKIQMPPPGKHPHQGLMNTAMFIFLAFGLMGVLLASILVSNAISTLMVKQIREIGVMKAIGARSGQVSMLYAVMIILICIAATVIGITASPFFARLLVEKFGNGFNINIYDASIPAWVFAVQVATGIFIPLVVASLPISKGGRITVVEALNNYGVSKKYLGKSLFENIISKIHFLGETTILSLRNVFRQPTRIILSIVLLATGGAVFMTAINFSKSWDVVLKRVYDNNKFDLELRTLEPMKDDTIINKIAQIKGVRKIEKWGYASASIAASKEKYELSRSYPDRGHGTTMFYGLPPSTEMVNFPIVAGRWLRNEKSNEIVLPTSEMKKYRIGDQIEISMEGKISQWDIVGFYEELGFPSLGYTSLNAFNKARQAESNANMLRISTVNRNAEAIIEIQKLVEKEKFPTISFASINSRIEVIEKHLVILVNALIAMGILTALVGAIGLMSVMSLSILERTRELGVMRAIGATPQKIAKLIVGEGIIIAVISLFLAILLSIIVFTFLGPYIGKMSFKGPVTVVISPAGIVIWILIVITCSIIATLYPAWRTNRMSVREALVYQ